MKTTTVPAQITTVEDMIAGNLSMSQVMLLAAPIFLGGAMYVILPPVMSLTTAKLVLSGLLLTIFFALAIRIKGTILLTWLIVIARYNIRPRYYLFNKNDTHLRNIEPNNVYEVEEVENTRPLPVVEKPVTRLAMPERVRLETAMSDPRSKLEFLTKRKGGLDVHITEIKQEG